MQLPFVLSTDMIKWEKKWADDKRKYKSLVSYKWFQRCSGPANAEYQNFLEMILYFEKITVYEGDL